jgi:hypothetical protein
MPPFCAILCNVRNLRDWLVKGNGFELSVPVSKLADDSF